MRVKFLLGVAVLLPAIVALMVLNVSLWNKWQDLANVKVAVKVFGTSTDLADLVYELQKERGLSAGFLGSDGRLFRDDVAQQRLKTEAKITSLEGFVDRLGENKYATEIVERWVAIGRVIGDRAEIRDNVDRLIDPRGNWSFYTNLIRSIITLYEKTRLMNEDIHFRRLSNDYVAVLKLQELAGQERGTVNNVISSRQLNTTTFQEISGYIAGQADLITQLQRSENGLPRGILENLTNKTINFQVDEVRRAITSKLFKNDALNRILSLVGYGGLIHNFKNYVLRGDDIYRQNFESHFSQAKNVILEYRHTPGTSNAEHEALSSIEFAFSQYEENLKTITAMRLNNSSVDEIDRAVIVDDQDALNGIELLRTYIAPTVAGDWFLMSTLRIDKINTARRQLKAFALGYMKQLEKEASLVIFLYGLLILFIVASTVTLSIFLKKRASPL